MARTGLLVVLEGGEGVGKTTQWTRLTHALEATGQEVVALREPGGTGPGDAIRALLLDSEEALRPATEALLFAASRAELVERAIRPALGRGVLVLLDRYLLSTYVYQGMARGLEASGLRAINQFATGGLVPDCTLLLQLPVQEALHRMQERGAPDRLEREGLAFHERVTRGFDVAAGAEWQQAHPECGAILAVSALGSASDVSARCLAVLADRWPERFTPPVGQTP